MTKPAFREVTGLEPKAGCVTCMPASSAIPQMMTAAATVSRRAFRREPEPALAVAAVTEVRDMMVSLAAVLAGHQET